MSPQMFEMGLGGRTYAMETGRATNQGLRFGELNVLTWVAHC